MATVPPVAGDERCPGCGARVPTTDHPTHAYIEAAPGCWEQFCALVAWCTGLPDAGVGTMQDLVDAYAAQHATNDERRNRQSVAVHLMSLCAGLELGCSGTQRRRWIGRWTGRDYVALVPRPERFPVTVVEVAAATEDVRATLVGTLAATTWSAWAGHHATVRSWVAEAGA